MPLILRSVKGSKLTIAEMDGNLLYLQALAMSGGTFTGSTNPAGSNAQVQFNDNDEFGADPDFTYDSNTQNLAVPSISTQNVDTSELTSTGKVQAAFFANSRTVSSNQTIPENTNSIIIGPVVTIGSGVDLTVSNNSLLTIFPVLEGSIPTVTTDSYQTYFNDTADVTATVTSDGGQPIMERGIVWSTNPYPTIEDNKFIDTESSLGQFTLLLNGFPPFQLVYARGFASNINGTAYGNQISFTPFVPCLAKGTEISMANGTKKKIEDVTYEDELLVWDFDFGLYGKAKPLWIGLPSKSSFHSRISFSDGSVIDSVIPHLGHRVLNIEDGRFAYPMSECHEGTTTFSDHGENPTIVKTELVFEDNEFYNIITERHINMFANGILTSCRWNNLYPIENMKFVKQQRVLRGIEEFSGLPEEYYHGLRASEQTCDASELVEYMAIREKYKKKEFENHIS